VRDDSDPFPAQAAEVLLKNVGELSCAIQPPRSPESWLIQHRTGELVGEEWNLLEPREQVATGTVEEHNGEPISFDPMVHFGVR
jgi:hypothetical protein